MNGSSVPWPDSIQKDTAGQLKIPCTFSHCRITCVCCFGVHWSMRGANSQCCIELPLLEFRSQDKTRWRNSTECLHYCSQYNLVQPCCALHLACEQAHIFSGLPSWPDSKSQDTTALVEFHHVPYGMGHTYRLAIIMRVCAACRCVFELRLIFGWSPNRAFDLKSQDSTAPAEIHQVSYRLVHIEILRASASGRQLFVLRLTFCWSSNMARPKVVVFLC